MLECVQIFDLLIQFNLWVANVYSIITKLLDVLLKSNCVLNRNIKREKKNGDNLSKIRPSTVL